MFPSFLGALVVVFVSLALPLGLVWSCFGGGLVLGEGLYI